MRRRRAGRLVLPGLLALWLAGCAAAEVPMPFVTNPDPETTAATPTAATPAAETSAPAPAAPAANAAAPAAAASSPASPAAAGAPANVHRGPMRADLEFPSFARPPEPGGKVMDDAQQKKMQSDLEALARQRETKMRQEIEQEQ